MNLDPLKTSVVKENNLFCSGALTILKYTKRGFSLFPGFDYEWKVKHS